MTAHSFFLLLAWCSCVSAIPFGPAAGPEYVVATWELSLVRSFWAKLWGQNAPAAKSTTEEDEDGRSLGWYDPSVNGGSMLDVRLDVFKKEIHSNNLQIATKRYGEPLNVIISGHSDPFILSEAGLHIYAKSSPLLSRFRSSLISIKVNRIF
jgi:hypothetical protein